MKRRTQFQLWLGLWLCLAGHDPIQGAAPPPHMDVSPRAIPAPSVPPLPFFWVPPAAPDVFADGEAAPEAPEEPPAVPEETPQEFKAQQLRVLKVRERAWTEILILEMQLQGERARAGRRTPDGSFPDIETPETAYEVDWCTNSKWKEAVGQAWFYARATGKRPGIILLMTGDEREVIYYLRCLVACGDEIELRTRFTGGDAAANAPIEAPRP